MTALQIAAYNVEVFTALYSKRDFKSRANYRRAVAELVRLAKDWPENQELRWPPPTRENVK